MITNLGKQHLMSYLAGLTPAIGQSLAVGISRSSVSQGSTQLGFEVHRVPVTSVSLDPENKIVVFKGTIDDGGGYTVSEVGLWSSAEADLDSSLIATFDEFTEGWEGDIDGFVEESPESRIGTTMMNLSVSSATPQVITYPIDAADLTGMLGPDDTWSIALHKIGTAALTVKLTLSSMEGSMTIDFFPSNITDAGYTFGSSLIKDATVTGSFDPSMVEEYSVSVVPAAGNSASSTVQLDGIVATNSPAEREGSVLVARGLITPSFTTSLSGSTDVEYRMSVFV